MRLQRIGSGIFGRVRFLATLMAVLGLLASAGLASAHDTAGQADGVTEVSFTIDNDEVLQEPEVISADEDLVRFRDLVTSDVLSGDISGNAVTHWKEGRIRLDEDCSGEACIDALFENQADVWGTIEIETEDGHWRGQTAYSTSADGTATGYMFLIGHDEHAGEAIVAGLEDTSADEPGVQFTGEMLTMDGPKQGMNVYFDGCAVPPNQGAGSMIVRLGDESDAGSWTSEYPMAQAGGASFGNVTMELEKGDVEGHLLLQANGDHRFGYFAVHGGTGEYEDLYGFGKIHTGVYESERCGENTGLGGYWIGQASAY